MTRGLPIRMRSLARNVPGRGTILNCRRRIIFAVKSAKRHAVLPPRPFKGRGRGRGIDREELQNLRFSIGWQEYKSVNDNSGANTPPPTPPLRGAGGSAACLFAVFISKVAQQELLRPTAYLMNSSSRYLGSVQRPSSTMSSSLSVSRRMASIFGHTVSW